MDKGSKCYGCDDKELIDCVGHMVVDAARRGQSKIYLPIDYLVRFVNATGCHTAEYLDKAITFGVIDWPVELCDRLIQIEVERGLKWGTPEHTAEVTKEFPWFSELTFATDIHALAKARERAGLPPSRAVH